MEITAKDHKQPTELSATQREINRLLGINTETFLKFNRPEPPSQIDAAQREVNRALGISEADFLKYAQPRSA
jgi:hypothetical protein